VSGHVIGTYLHGPCLARNPQISDLLLGWACGRELEFIEEPEVTELREERLRTVLG
jgi:CobQ-like glutamine amidotransferase family enzyme